MLDRHDPVATMEEFIKTTISLSTEQNIESLLNQIVSTARQLTGAEAGRVYLLDRTKRYLYPKVSQNDIIDTPLVYLSQISLYSENQRNTKHPCTYCAFSGEPLNIPDIYRYSGLDCTDFYNCDRYTGYNTQSLLALPLLSYTEITSGILLLLNFRDPKSGDISHFPSHLESLVKAFASQAAVAVDNAQLIEQNTRLINLLNETNQQLEQENRVLKQKMGKQGRFTDSLIGESAAMQHVFNLMEKVLNSNATVLLRGETGTGKELIAKAIHEKSPRCEAPFIDQNCAALPETLLESLLFGHKRGSFSGADKDKKGLIEAADGGTLFLDEIGDMPIGLQAKILRVLQEQTVRPLGALKNRKINVRIIAATHCDLESLIKEGQFREDLYYRLCVFPIDVPPLRARKEDLPTLLQHFLSHYSEQYNKQLRGFSPPAFEVLLRYDYPGNIRELKNRIEQAVLLSEPGGSILLTHLNKTLLDQTESSILLPTLPPGTLKDMLQQYETAIIQQSLQAHNGNQTRTAETLGLSRRSLVGKIRRYQIKM